MATIQIQKTSASGSYVVRIDERRYSVVHDSADFRADYMIDSETTRGPRTLDPRGPLSARIVALVKEFEHGEKSARIEVARGEAVKLETGGKAEKEQAWRLGYNAKIEAAKEPKAAAEPTAINEPRYTVGLNMNCDKAVVKVTLLHMTESDEHGFDCVTMSDNIKVKGRAANLFMTEAEALATITTPEPSMTQTAPAQADAQAEATANADAHLISAGMPTYGELRAALQGMLDKYGHKNPAMWDETEAKARAAMGSPAAPYAFRFTVGQKIITRTAPALLGRIAARGEDEDGAYYRIQEVGSTAAASRFEAAAVDSANDPL